MKRIAAVFVLAATPSLALAGSQDELAAGGRVRARIQDAKGADEWIVGRLVDADDASVTIRTARGEAVAIPLRRLDRLDRSLGRRSAGRGALRGAGLGFASGAVLGALAGAVGSDGGSSPACNAPPRGDAQWLEAAACGASLGRGPESATMGAAVLGTAGAVLGGLVGSLAPGERWERTSVEHVRVSIEPRRGGVGGAVSFSF
jgi:hypothetical protein